MIKRALPAVFGFFTICLPLAAQEQADYLAESEIETITLKQLRHTGALDTASALTLYRPDIFSTSGGSVLIHGLPALTLLDGRRFPLSNSLGRMGMTALDLFPVAFLSAVEVEKVNPSPRYGTDSPGGVVNLRPNRVYAGGEVGVFYGRSSGKFGREDKEAYILGGVGNDKFNITVGVAHRESEGRGLHLDRQQLRTAP
jgi:outer membrane receptor protein involved in Fe transport